MRRVLGLAGAGLLTVAMVWGCGGSDTTPPPSSARVPGQYERRMATDWQAKPLPGPSGDELPPPPFADAPLVSQQAPETQRFVDAYDRVGRPRILVWVSHSGDAFYDEAAARSIDYDAVENILADWLSAGGRVATIAPEAARQALTPQQAQSLNSGQAGNGQDLADRVRADVLVLVRAQPTRQSGEGPAVRLVADASNLKGGESLGRAVVDVPPPLDKPKINTYTRFLARKLMTDMTGAWSAYGGGPPPQNAPADAAPARQSPAPPPPQPFAPQPPPPAAAASQPDAGPVTAPSFNK